MSDCWTWVDYFNIPGHVASFYTFYIESLEKIYRYTMSSFSYWNWNSNHYKLLFSTIILIFNFIENFQRYMA